MLKNDYKKEVENTLDLIYEEVDKSIADEDYNKATEQVNKGLKSLVGLDLGTIDVFSFESISEIIDRENQYNSLKYLAFGCLMNLMGILCRKNSSDSSYIIYYEKALDGFNKAFSEEDEIDEKYYADVVDTCKELSKYDLSIDTDKKVLRLYEAVNKFDKAEDTLFYMLQKTNNDGTIILEGMKFYNRLKGKEKDVLKDGNLPFEEVEDGISELEKRLGL